MKFNKEQLNADELSKLIDALNNREQAESNDPELQELADLAMVVKKAAGQTKPTKQTVDAIARELKEESHGIMSKRRFGWLYSGAAGMAAAIMLVAATNFAPVSPENSTPQMPPQVQISEVLPQPDTAQSSISPKQSSVSDKVEMPNTFAKNQRTIPNQAASGHAEKQSAPKVAKQAPSQAAQAGVMAARSADVPTKQAGILATPDKSAKVSSGGSDIDAIKQGGYAFNDNKEVTITQKAKVGDSAKTDSPVRAAIMKEEIAKDGKDKKAEPANKITAAKDDDEVEGEGSKEELQEADDSLDKSESSPESGKE